VGGNGVLHVDGGDPLAAALDDVLEPVGELEIAVGVDGTEVAAAPVAVEEPAGVLIELVVALDDPRPAQQHLALAYAVEGDVVTGLVDQPEVHARQQKTLAAHVVPFVLAGERAAQRRLEPAVERYQRGGLGGAVRVDDVGPGELVEVAHQR
jgi:hypothetical protein